MTDREWFPFGEKPEAHECGCYVQVYCCPNCGQKRLGQLMASSRRIAAQLNLNLEVDIVREPSAPDPSPLFPEPTIG